MKPKNIFTVLLALIISILPVAVGYHFYHQDRLVKEANEKLKEGYVLYLYGKKVNAGDVEMSDALNEVYIDDKNKVILIERNRLWNLFY